MKEIKFNDAVVIPVMTKHNITREEAEKRLHCLYESGILEGGVESLESRQMIDHFLALDSEEGAAKVLFEKTLNQCIENKVFVKEYDRISKRNLTKVLREIEAGHPPKNAQKEISRFGDFVETTVYAALIQKASKPTQP